MPRKAQKQKQKVATSADAEKPTQKKALAEALRHLGPNASHAALVRFVKERFGMELTFCIVIPKADTIKKPKVLIPPVSKSLCPRPSAFDALVWRCLHCVGQIGLVPLHFTGTPASRSQV